MVYVCILHTCVLKMSLCDVSSTHVCSMCVCVSVSVWLCLYLPVLCCDPMFCAWAPYSSCVPQDMGDEFSSKGHVTVPFSIVRDPHICSAALLLAPVCGGLFQAQTFVSPFLRSDQFAASF